MEVSQVLTDWQKTLEKLPSFEKLPLGWNGYNAPPPRPCALQNAQAFLTFLQQENYPPARLAPSVVGGVGMTFRHGQRKVYVEFSNQGTVCSLFGDGESEPITEDFSSNKEGFQSLIQKTREYLDG